MDKVVVFVRKTECSYCSMSSDLILAVSPKSIVVGEDGTGEFVSISKIGYSFGSVSFTLRPMTYSEYLDSEDNLDQLFPFRPPIEASCKMVK